MSYFVPEPVIDEWRRRHLGLQSGACEIGRHENCGKIWESCECACHDELDELEDMTGWDAEP